MKTPLKKFRPSFLSDENRMASFVRFPSDSIRMNFEQKSDVRNSNYFRTLFGCSNFIRFVSESRPIIRMEIGQNSPSDFCSILIRFFKTFSAENRTKIERPIFKLFSDTFRMVEFHPICVRICPIIRMEIGQNSPSDFCSIFIRY
jgi:hypothetical protein